MGIARDFLPHVFDRFRQADSSSTRMQGGLGLGLAIVRHLVEVHGGTVRAESEGDGQGARFTVRMPVRQFEDQPAEGSAVNGGGPHLQAVKQIEPVSLAGIRVLVVDDEADARELIRVMLGTHGAEVVVVASADEAMEEIARDPPDALVSDIGLPGEDGYALIRRVRSQPATARLPALALTAYASAADHRRALEAGFQRHVAKPVEPAELAGVLAAMVAEARARAAGSTPSAGPGGPPPMSLAAAWHA
jgi:CheY-like chemotaxis protein